MNSELSKPKRNFWQVVFLSPDEPRLRAGWRLLIQTILLAILGIVAGIIFFVPVGLLKISYDSTWTMLANEMATLVSVTGSIFLARKFLDKRSITSLGLKLNGQALKDVLVGIVITFFQMGLVYILEMALGWTKFNGFAWETESGVAVITGLGVWLIIFLFVGWQEELLSRGYHLQTIESGLNTLWAVLISSSIFAILHLGNPSASWVSTLGILLAGLFLALPYILTRQLWLSIGLHIGWNFFEGVVFGFQVSGLDTFRLLRHTVTGPELWTGGGFGPEAGLLVIPALLLGSLLIVAYTKSGLRQADAE